MIARKLTQTITRKFPVRETSCIPRDARRFSDLLEFVLCHISEMAEQQPAYSYAEGVPANSVLQDEHTGFFV